MNDGSIITLAELINILQVKKPDTAVYFDFCRFVPTKLDSYRGYYDQLALDFTQGEENTVGNLLAECKSALGKTFHGYKGGEYRMGADTPIWVADHGQCYGTALTGYDEETTWALILTTRHID